LLVALTVSTFGAMLMWQAYIALQQFNLMHQSGVYCNAATYDNAAPHGIATGDIEREMDPYFPFEEAVDVWARTFAGLGIQYKGARMRLDLCDRPGKYSNGFCHWPQPAWRRVTPLHCLPAPQVMPHNCLAVCAGRLQRAGATMLNTFCLLESLWRAAWLQPAPNICAAEAKARFAHDRTV